MKEFTEYHERRSAICLCKFETPSNMRIDRRLWSDACVLLYIYIYIDEFEQKINIGEG